MYRIYPPTSTLYTRSYRADNKSAFFLFPYPARWKYNILRALDYFQHANISWDHRMRSAIDVLLSKRKKSGMWNINAKHPRKEQIEMEKAGKSSRWITLKAMRILKHFQLDIYANESIQHTCKTDRSSMK